MDTRFPQALAIRDLIVCIDGFGCAGHHDSALKASCQGVDVITGSTRNPLR